MGDLTPEQRERLENSLRWHFAAHADQPDQSFASLGVANALSIVEQLLAEQRQGIAAAIGGMAVRGPDNRMRHATTIRDVAARIAETYGGEQ
jgi:hypothetical protein